MMIPTFALLLFPLFVQDSTPTIDPATRLARARMMLRNSAEPAFRQGASWCVGLDSSGSAALLLAVLNESGSSRGLPSSHYRDIAWMSLSEFENLDAHLRVVEELSRSKSAWVRAWCAELLARYVIPRYGDARLVDALLRALDDHDVFVQRAAARALGRAAAPPAVSRLLTASEADDPYLRANAVEALAETDRWRHRRLFLDHLTGDSDGGVRCALLAALPRFYADDVATQSARALLDEDWRPRLQAVENLEDVRSRYAIEALVLATADVRATIARRAMRALTQLTGLHHGRADAWKRWWEEERGEYELPDEVQPAEGTAELRSKAEYHGHEVRSDRLAFLMDRSGDMRKQLESAETTKSEASEAALERTLMQLDRSALFNVYCYQLDYTALANGLEPVTERMARRAVTFVKRTRAGGQRDVWRVLEAVVTNPDIDTVYLLSSGEPDTGLYVHHDRIAIHLRDLNRFHKTVVHTVSFASTDWYKAQLEQIAAATEGEHRSVE